MGTPLRFAWDNLLSLISQWQYELNLIFLLLLQLAGLSDPAHTISVGITSPSAGAGLKFSSPSSLTTDSLGACSDAMVKGLLFHNWDLSKNETKQKPHD